MIFKTKPNKHDFWPPEIPWPAWKPERTGYIITPDKDAKYLLPGREQEDWLKAFGWSFYWFDHTKEAVMVGLRYDPEKDKWQFTSYVHVDGKTIKGKANSDTEVMIECERGESIYAWINIDYKSKLYEVNFSDQPGRVIDTVMIHFSHGRKLAKKLGMYFGSNNKAPSKFSIYKNKIWKYLAGLPMK